jgi:hypothetical protein
MSAQREKAGDMINSERINLDCSGALRARAPAVSANRLNMKSSIAQVIRWLGHHGARKARQSMVV